MDFEGLRALNGDAVGWLRAGDCIDLPVVQGDNDFYLSHGFDRRSDINGALFVNALCSLDPRDDVVLLHGHNMKSGAMFGTLRRFEQQKYACRHPLVRFVTPLDGEGYYAPVAAFNASMAEDDPEYFDLMRLRFADEAAFEAYLAELRARSLWESPLDARSGDALLVLATCSYAQEDGRFLLFLRRLRPDETPEAVEALFAKG